MVLAELGFADDGEGFVEDFRRTIEAFRIEFDTGQELHLEMPWSEIGVVLGIDGEYLAIVFESVEAGAD